MSNLTIDSFLLTRNLAESASLLRAQNNFSERDNHQQTLIADKYDEQVPTARR